MQVNKCFSSIFVSFNCSLSGGARHFQQMELFFLPVFLKANVDSKTSLSYFAD